MSTHVAVGEVGKLVMVVRLVYGGKGNPYTGDGLTEP